MKTVAGETSSDLTADSGPLELVGPRHEGLDVSQRCKPGGVPDAGRTGSLRDAVSTQEIMPTTDDPFRRGKQMFFINAGSSVSKEKSENDNDDKQPLDPMAPSRLQSPSQALPGSCPETP